MVPTHCKSTAMSKKLQLLCLLRIPHKNAPCTARNRTRSHPRKIVVKRLEEASVLVGVSPGCSLSGKAVRFGVVAVS